MRRLPSQRGFTLVELLVSAAIFVILVAVAVEAYVNVFIANRKANAARQVVDEGSFAMERLVKEIRNGVIDYPEYAAWANKDTIPEAAAYLANAYAAGTAGSGDAKAYHDVYANLPPDVFSPRAIAGDEDTAMLDTVSPGAPQTSTLQEPGLALLSPDGNARVRVYLWNGPDEDGTGTRGRLVLIREKLVRDTSDPANERWYWIDIDGSVADPATHPPKRAELTSDKIDVTAFSFTITPHKDPFFAFSDTTVQQQPFVRVRLALRTAPTEIGLAGNLPSISLDTTLSVRSYATALWTAQ